MRYVSAHDEVELLHIYKNMLRRLFTRFNGNSVDEQLRSAAANLRNMVEGPYNAISHITFHTKHYLNNCIARALVDGNYSQYEGSLVYTDPQYLHSTPSREDLTPIEIENNFKICEYCGQVYNENVLDDERPSIFGTQVYLPTSEAEPNTSTSTIDSSRPVRMVVCHFCHSRRLVSSTEPTNSEESRLQSTAEEFMSISLLGDDTDQKSSPKKVQLSFDLELGEDGSITQINPNGPAHGQRLNIKFSILPPPNKPSSPIQQSIPTKRKSTQTPNLKSGLQLYQHSFIRRERFAEQQSDSPQMNKIWENIDRKQDGLMRYFSQMTDALVELVEFCAKSKSKIVVNPFWGYGTFEPTSCFYHFGDPTSVNLLLSTVGRYSGSISEKFVTTLSLVRAVLNRRAELQQVFRVKFVSDMLAIDDDVDRVLREVSEVFGESTIVDFRGG